MEKLGLVETTNERTPFIEQSKGGKFLDFYRRHKVVVTIGAIMILLLPLLGLLALRNRGARAEWTSPLVYPSPQGYGAADWAQAYSKAQSLVAKMTLEEMNNITLGVSTANTGCVGLSGSVPRVGFPGLCLHDAGNGVRDTDGVYAYASGLHIGATWNASLAYDRAFYMGAEFRRKGVNVALGPVVGPVGRLATNGRNWEAFASDPYLNGILGAQSVLGLQKSVIASIKHFVAYEQETNRNPITNGHDGVVHSTSANLDDKTMHELYVWPFQDLIYAGAGSVMCSYNRINNTYACENSKAMNGILKGELNFQGFVVSDWAGQHSSLPSANAGLDMAMPNSQYWDKDQLARAVDSQTMNRTRLVDMATRVVATWYQFGQDDTLFPSTGVGMAKDLLAPHTFVDARDPASKPSLLDQAIQGHVLVKNVNNSLPLKSPKVLSVFGYDAVAQTSFDPGEGTFAQNWEAVGLQQQQFQDLASNSPVSSAPSRFMGTLIVGGGSGSNTPSYISTPFEALQQRAYQDDTVLFHDFTSTDPGVVATSDACLVFINEYASEAWDRPGLADQESDQLVKNVAAHCRNTIVVIHNAGTRLVDAWIDNKNVTAVIFAHLPGQEAGRSVVQLLYGDASPSGRLPYTVAKKASDYGSLLTACQAQGSNSPQCDFDEGVNIDYRSFLARGVTPRFAFGYGLTYSSFEYSNLQMSINATATPSNARSAPVYTNGTTDQNQNNALVGVAGLTSLFDNVGMITAMISNTGGISAAEVAQLYIQLPASSTSSGSAATRVLRGFNKVTVQPGSSAQVSFQLRRKDVSFWDTVSQSWVIPSGQFLVFVGKSVLDTPLTGSFTTT